MDKKVVMRHATLKDGGSRLGLTVRRTRQVETALAQIIAAISALDFHQIGAMWSVMHTCGDDEPMTIPGLDAVTSRLEERRPVSRNRETQGTAIARASWVIGRG